VAAGAFTLAGLAYMQRLEADRQRSIAVTNEVRARDQESVAVTERDRAQKNLIKEARTASHWRAEQSAGALTKEPGEGDPVTAMLIALEGLPDQRADDEFLRTRPFVPEVFAALHGAMTWPREFRESKLLSGSLDEIFSAEFSPDGTLILTASDDKIARLWRKGATGTWASIGMFLGHEGRVTRGDFSPDGTKVLTASADKTARLWAKSSDGAWATVAVLKGHEGSVNSAVFSPDGTRILTASADNTAQLWVNGSDGAWTTVAVLKGHESYLTSAVFSPDGTRILTASWDKTARLWDAWHMQEALIGRAKVATPRCLTTEQRSALHLSGPAPAWCEAMQKWPYNAHSLANMHFEEGRFRAAVAEYERALDQKPAALKETEKVELAPRLAKAHETIAWYAFLDATLRAKPADDLAGEALTSATKAVELAPEVSNGYCIRGQIYLALGQVNKAIFDLDRAFALGADGSGAYLAHGRAKETMGDREAAIADYRKALANNAPSGYAKYAQGQARERLSALGDPTQP